MEYKMKTKIIMLVLVFFTSFLLSAETVLLYTMVDIGVIDEQQFGDLIESAVMNEFFDAGHIVFNADISGEAPDRGMDYYKESDSLQMAKAGGAGFVLEVKLTYNEVKGKSLPDFAEYRFINVLSGNMMDEGSVSIDKKLVEKYDLEKGLAAMGSEVADSVLNYL